MKFDISGNPDFGDLTVALAPGETFWAESGTMSRMSSDMQVSSRLLGGLFASLFRKALGGESFFIAEYTASNIGMVALAPTYPGTVLHRRMEGETFYLTKGSFLGCTTGITLKTKFGGMKAFFSGEGAFLIECSGHGDLFFTSYGAIIEREVNGAFTVDTGHLVAWEPSLQYSIGGMGGIKQTLFSGEGLVMKFTGQGKIFLQTRYLGGFAHWLSPFCR